MLNMLPEISVMRANKLISYYNSASRIFTSNIEEISAAGELNESLAVKILTSVDKIDVDKEIKKADELGLEILIPENDSYPQHLKTLQDFPVVLYAKGKFDKNDIYSVAIVGTREPTDYGKKVTQKLSKEFANLGVTVVSGLARGIDTVAHTQSLNSGGRTIAVLGNGMNFHYPPENQILEDKISKCGAVISEFPLDTSPDRFNFPKRNRLIAALSLGTIVIEGSDKSGTLITAKFAAEQGKDVFAVPGDVFSKYSYAPHFLLKQGARLIDKAEDVIEEISDLNDWLIRRLKIQEEQRKQQEDLPALMNKTEEKIIKILSSCIDGVNIDKLQKQICCGFGELSQSLLSLELRKKVKSLPGKVYIKI
ncbi:MAG: DNA-processing protein DprA [Elusimicrobia bacterium]|nr:DNA-processing protein DprA [Elusimicrobiota bacterium]